MDSLFNHCYLSYNEILFYLSKRKKKVSKHDHFATMPQKEIATMDGHKWILFQVHVNIFKICQG